MEHDPRSRECPLLARYADSAAVMTHGATLGVKFVRRILEVRKPARFVVYGPPHQEVKNALSRFSSVAMQPVGGFRRDTMS